MPSALLAAWALCGLPLIVQPQAHLSDASWPTHAVVAAAKGTIKPGHQLYVRENDRPIVSQVEVISRWPDGSPKWLHALASFRYEHGKPARYELAYDPDLPKDMPPSPLVVKDEPSGIQINTGAVSLVIPRPFAGITLARVGQETVLDGIGGPSLVDDRGIHWHARYDDKAKIIVEQQGPAQVTVRAEGWYQSADRAIAPFCRFVTRITAFAGSPIVKFDHATIFADDMCKQSISEAAFTFPLAGATRFASGAQRGKFSDQLAAIWFAQVTANHLITIAQPGSAGGKPRLSVADARSPGWFTGDVADQRVVLLTKDLWQKCPKEVQVNPKELVYYPWPRHGELAVPAENATRIDQVYKFQCFLTGRLLDSRLPSDYFAALEAQTDSQECKAEFARGANLEGLAMHNEFALAFLPASKNTRRDLEHAEKLQALYEQSPLASVGPAALAASGALGHVVESGPEFPEVQQAVREGMLGYAHSIERYGDYGWCIYGNTHSEELMNPATAGVPGGRPSLHRVWNNNHYQHGSTSWRLFALDGDPRLLAWARTCTDNYASIGQVRYDGQRGYVDGKGEHHDGADVRFHKPGGFWHCKAFVPWGSRPYGTEMGDHDSSLWGHWPDPSALLYAWIFDANRWAKDGHELWLKNVKLPDNGDGREINCTLVHAINAYEYAPRPELLAVIKGMARGLSVRPLTQQLGAIGEPTWMTRYHELFPDDAAFNKYILENARAIGDGGIVGSWALAMSATAYQLTKDENFLRQHAGPIHRTVRRLFHDPNPDKRWDLYGFAPGQRDGHLMLQWHHFAAALRDAHITSLPPPNEPGVYWCGISRFDNRADVAARGMKILVWKESQSANISVQALAIGGGSMHATSLRVLSPRHESLLSLSPLGVSREPGSQVRMVRPSSWRVAYENHPFPEGDTALYSLLVGSNGIGLFQPLTNQPECQVLRNSKVKDASETNPLFAMVTRGYLAPLTTGKIQLNFTASGTMDGSYVSLYDRQGKPILVQYLRAGDSTTATINEPGGPAGPWLLDVFSDISGYVKLTISAGIVEPLLYGSRLEDVELIRQKLGK